MITTKINDNLIYQEYLTDLEMYSDLDNYLNNGYEIVRTMFLCPVLKKDNKELILSYIHIDNPDTDIEAKINSSYQNVEIMEPDYSDTILNVLAGFRENYGYTSKYKKNESLFDRKYKNCIVMLLDGMGVNVLEKNLSEDSFLRTHYSYSEHAIYPSTTAASTTSTVSGLTPLESGWTGWANWIREMNREIVLFNGLNYFTDEQTGRSGYDFMPYKAFFNDMDIDGYVVNPDFSKEEKDINDVLNRSLKYLSNGKPQVQYVYYTDPDGIMHKNGTYDNSIKEVLKEIDHKVKEYSEKLPEDTLLVIAADHGHIPVETINLYGCNRLLNMLDTKPSNDARCMVFRVKSGFEKEFVSLFNALYGNIYKLDETSEFIRKGYFGNKDDVPHERIKDFLGNYIAVATNYYYFNYSGEHNFVFKSHHAGITKDEMEVPVIIVRK